MISIKTKSRIVYHTSRLRKVTGWTALDTYLVLTFKRILPLKNKKILLIANSPVMAEHIHDFEALFLNDNYIETFVYINNDANRFTKKILKNLHTWFKSKIVGRIIAHYFPWDLIIAPDHGIASYFDNHIAPMVYIGHGAWNKICGEKNTLITISSVGYTQKGEWRFVKMFCSSKYICNEAEKENPDLRGRIAVVGDLQYDRLLKIKKERISIRKKLGVQESTILVMFLGSWGNDSLFQKLGDYLLKEAKEMVKNNYRFIINIHPNEYCVFSKTKRIWGTYLESFCENNDGFIMRKRDEVSDKYFIASDVIIADHTCLADIAFLLKKPILLAPVSSEYIWNKSITSLGRKIAPKLNEKLPLHEQIEQYALNQSIDQISELSDKMLSYKGLAATRIKDEIYKLLNLKRSE